jgi:hypothetical protein
LQKQLCHLCYKRLGGSQGCKLHCI